MRKSIVEKAGGFRKEFDGAQDYDFIFRCTENAGEVLHVPEILYHWRTHKASTADNPASKMYAFEAGKRAIEAHLERTGTKRRGKPYTGSGLLPGEISGAGKTSGVCYHTKQRRERDSSDLSGNAGEEYRLSEF